MGAVSSRFLLLVAIGAVVGGCAPRQVDDLEVPGGANDGAAIEGAAQAGGEDAARTAGNGPAQTDAPGPAADAAGQEGSGHQPNAASDEEAGGNNASESGADATAGVTDARADVAVDASDGPGPSADASDAPSCSSEAGFSLSVCNGECVDLESSSTDCGRCGNICPQGTACLGGYCACPSGLLNCLGKCVDPMTDPLNCGQCGVVCVPARCGPGGCADCVDVCEGSCVELSVDRFNCGACGHSCSVNEICVQGTCTEFEPPPADAGLD